MKLIVNDKVKWAGKYGPRTGRVTQVSPLIVTSNGRPCSPKNVQIVEPADLNAPGSIGHHATAADIMGRW